MKTMNTFKVTLVACVVLGSVVADAATVQIKAGMSGLWDQKTSYEGGALPVADDTIEIATGVQATANKADCDFIATTGIKELKFSGTVADQSSSLTITIAEGETATIPSTTASSKSAGIIKKGLGMLQFTATVARPFYADFTVDEGVLKFGETGGNHHLNCAMTVKAGATFVPYTYATSGTAATTYFRKGLFGEGTISNPSGQQIGLNFLHNAENAVFAGNLNGLFKVTIGEETVQRFTGTAAFTEAHMSGEALLGLSAFGSIAYEMGEANTLEYLGSGENSTATLTGTKDVKSITVSGGDRGGLSLAGAIDYSATTNANVDVVLAGDNVAACTFSGALVPKAGDGYTSRLVKEGTGTWTRVLGIDNLLTTSNQVVKVKDGRLSFSLAAGKYTWYKLTIKATIGSSKTLTLARFGLYGENGTLQSAGLTENVAAFDDWTLLQPGQVTAFNTGSIAYSDLTNQEGNVANLFKATAITTSSSSWTPCGSDLRPKASDDKTWSGCVLRMPEGAAEIAYYDIAPYHCSSITSSRAGYGPKTWVLEGSYDGVHWTTISSVTLALTEADVKAMDKQWYGNRKVCFSADDNTTAGRWGVNSGAPEVDSVAITQGATVDSNFSIMTDRIEVKYTNAGKLTIDGFALAAGGVLDIVNVAKSSFTIPCNLTGLDLPASYTILVNGEMPTKEVVISDDKMSIGTVKSGMVLIFR